jgi:hypothetical protein
LIKSDVKAPKKKLIDFTPQWVMGCKARDQLLIHCVMVFWALEKKASFLPSSSSIPRVEFMFAEL